MNVLAASSPEEEGWHEAVQLRLKDLGVAAGQPLGQRLQCGSCHLEVGVPCSVGMV